MKICFENIISVFSFTAKGAVDFTSKGTELNHKIIIHEIYVSWNMYKHCMLQYIHGLCSYRSRRYCNKNATEYMKF